VLNADEAEVELSFELLYADVAGFHAELHV